jgi:ABC-type transport system involved in Fe-S cluster assembly fused permease/ATPase subunit
MNDINLSYECLNGVSIHCQNIRLALIKAQLAAGALIAVTCFIYLIIYTIVASRVSRADRHQVSAAADPAMVPAYQTPLTSVINYQHQPYMNSPHAHQSSAPVMMPAYQSANYVPTIYPQIPNDRF